jgi:hypothetical protein
VNLKGILKSGNMVLLSRLFPCVEGSTWQTFMCVVMIDVGKLVTHHEGFITVPIAALRTTLLAVTVLVLSGHAPGASAVWNQKGAAWEGPADWSTGQTSGPDDITVFPDVGAPIKNQPVVAGSLWSAEPHDETIGKQDQKKPSCTPRRR